MNYIPYPRTDKDSHPDLVAWRFNLLKKDGTWKLLKTFLHECTKILNATDALPKCWYSELPQGDNYALDVEHYRPKGSGDPLTVKQIKEIEVLGNMKYEQNEISGTYAWLKFDYRNYRLVTATPNRAGAKHIYFPISKNTTRLTNGQFPWCTDEYSYFLDPTNKEDTSLLFVKPNGKIAPTAPCTQLLYEDYNNLPNAWRNDGFNYLRAVVTIKMFRLNDTIFIQGRKKVYDDTLNALVSLDILLSENTQSEVIPRFIENIVKAVLPSAPFSLAAKSALKAFQSERISKQIFAKIKHRIITSIDNEINSIVIDWSRT